MRICTKCNVEKNDIDFTSKRTVCKCCTKEYKKTYYLNNKETINTRNKTNRNKLENKKIAQEYNKQYREDNKCKLYNSKKTYYENNKDKVLESNARYRADNKDKLNEQSRIYYHNNKEKFKEYENKNKVKIRKRQNERVKQRLKTDVNFKLKLYVSAAINLHLRNNNSNKNMKNYTQYLPYSIQELREHIETKFEPWMNWNNRGVYDPGIWNDNDQSTWTWQIDHIIPISHFLITSVDDEEFTKCWCLKNLRPYSAKQNVIDGNRR